MPSVVAEPSAAWGGQSRSIRRGRRLSGRHPLPVRGRCLLAHPRPPACLRSLRSAGNPRPPCRS